MQPWIRRTSVSATTTTSHGNGRQRLLSNTSRRRSIAFVAGTTFNCKGKIQKRRRPPYFNCNSFISKAFFSTNNPHCLAAAARYNNRDNNNNNLGQQPSNNIFQSSSAEERRLARQRRQHQQGRSLPPHHQLDEWQYEEGFGAYDYELDDFDKQAASQNEQENWQFDDNGNLVPIHQTTAREEINTSREAADVNVDRPDTITITAADDDENEIPKKAQTTTEPQEKISASRDERNGDDIMEQNTLEDDEAIIPTKTTTRAKSFSKTTTTATKKPAVKEIANNMEMTPSDSNHDNNSTDSPNPRKNAAFYQRASQGLTGQGYESELASLQDELSRILSQLQQLTQNDKFNPNSAPQVSRALYGVPGESTNKDVLEAMAASGNELADFVLNYRSLTRRITKLQKRHADKEKGTYVRNVATVKRTRFADRIQQQQRENNSKVGSKNGKADENDNAATPQSSSNDDDKKVAIIEQDDPLLLVDASAYIFRAYYAYPPLHRSDGMPVGAVLGFCNMLNRLVLNMMMKGEQPRIVLVFDSPGPTFRHELYGAYKANRAEAPVDLIPQFQLIRQVATAYGIVQMEAPAYEADDTIATLARLALEEGLDANILSGDKDLMQLVTPSNIQPCVQMIDPMTMSRVSYEDVVEKWGVPPERLGDVLALAGDSVDNVPGVPGIGPKIAATLIDEFGSLDNLLDNVKDVKQKGRREKLQANLEQARLSRVLVELDRNVPMERLAFPTNVTQVSDLRMSPMDPDALVDFFDEMGLKDLKRRFQSRLESERGVRGGGASSGSRTSASKPSKSRPRSKFTPRPKATIPKPEDFSDIPF